MVLIGLCVLLATAPLCKLLDQQKATTRVLNNYKIVSTQPTASGSELALAVDGDGRVVSLLLEKDKTVKSSLTLGFEAKPSSDFPFGQSLPKDEVLVAIHRLSSERGTWKIWVGLTFALVKDEAIEGAYRLSECLYVFRQSLRNQGVLLRKCYPRIADFDFDDVNADRLVEIAVHYEGGGVSYSGFLDVWQLTREGSLISIPLENVEADLVNGSKVDIRLGAYRYGDYSVLREEKCPMKNGWRIVRKYYSWDVRAKRYRLAKTIEIEERVIR